MNIKKEIGKLKKTKLVKGLKVTRHKKMTVKPLFGMTTKFWKYKGTAKPTPTKKKKKPKGKRIVVYVK